MRNILVLTGSGKRKESKGVVQIFRIFGHQQPCRYKKKSEGEIFCVSVCRLLSRSKILPG